MSAVQASSVIAMLLSAAFLRTGASAVAGDIASLMCIPASSFDAGNASGRWRLEAAIGPACLAGPLPAWHAEVRMLGIRAAIQHDAGGFPLSFDAGRLHPGMPHSSVPSFSGFRP